MNIGKYRDGYYTFYKDNNDVWHWPNDSKNLTTVLIYNSS